MNFNPNCAMRKVLFTVLVTTPKVGLVAVEFGGSELRVIEQIEELGAELDVQPFHRSWFA